MALLGSALLTLGVGLLGARIDPRGLLLAAALLMIATGLGFASTPGFALLAAIALVGTINPSAGSVSVFAPLEQAMLTSAAPDGCRGRARDRGCGLRRGMADGPVHRLRCPQDRL